MKKVAIFIMFAIFVSVVSNSYASFLNSFKDGFYFEKFEAGVRYDRKTDSYRSIEAQNELIKMHPVGSNVDDLRKTLEDAGALSISNNDPRYTDIIFYEYHNRELLVFKVRWRVNIKQDNGKILDIAIISGIK